MGRLSGYKALVTGGTRGLGRAISGRLTIDGAQVTVTGTMDCCQVSAGCQYRAVNFLDREATEEFAEEAARMEFDILINNAGINRISEFEKINLEDFDNIHQVNVRAPFVLCRAVIPHMKKKGWGRIVNISSIFGKVSKEFRASYSASKFAIDGLTAALAAEVARFGIIANCVAPGVIDTELTRTILGERGINELVSKIPVGRLGRPEEVALLVAWLASPENTYISGQNIAIDGGFTRV